MDDATSSLMQLRFVTSEGTFSYFEALDLYLAAHGRPVAFYSGKHSLFPVANQSAQSGHGMTQFGRTLSAILEHIKAEQDKAAPKKHQAGKQRTRYQPNGRRNTESWNSKLAQQAKKKAKTTSTHAAE